MFLMKLLTYVIVKVWSVFSTVPNETIILLSESLMLINVDVIRS